MRLLISIAILVLSVALSARGQAVRNLNGSATNLTLRGPFTNRNISGTATITFTPAEVGGFSSLTIDTDPFGSPVVIDNGEITADKFTAIGTFGFVANAVPGFAGDGSGLTNLPSATNFSSSVTYNFNGKTTFNSVSYNTNAWAGPTNTLVLTTNYQDFVASTDCNITAVGGQLAGQNTWSTLTVSNSTAANITVRVTASGLRAQGGSTTNALTIGAGKEGVLSFLSRDFKSTNYVTTAQSN